MSSPVLAKLEYNNLLELELGDLEGLVGLLEEVVRWHRDDVLVEGRGIDHLGNKVGDGARTQETHVHLELISEDLDSLLDTRLAVTAEGIQEWSTNANCLRTQCQRLENIARSPDASIDVDLKFRIREVATGAKSRSDLNKDFKAGSCCIELSTTVIGKDDTLNTGLVGKDCVFRGGNSLENDRHWRCDNQRSVFDLSGNKKEDPKNLLLVTLWNHGMSFHDKLGSMKDCG